MGSRTHRKLGLALVAWALVGSGVAQSAIINADPDASRATIQLGGLPAITLARNGTGTASLTGPQSNLKLYVTGPVWQTTSLGPSTSLFTGIPFVSALVAGFTNPTLYSTANSMSTKTENTRPRGVAYNNATVPNPVGPGSVSEWVGFGGAKGHLDLLNSVGTQQIVLNLGNAGRKPVATSTVNWGTPAVLTFAFTLGPWFRDHITMTGLTTNYVQIPGRDPGEQTGLAFTLNPKSSESQRTFTVGGNFITSFPNELLLVATQASLAGTSNFPGSSGTGTITLVTPMRVDFGEVAGVMPGAIRMKFSFVPEPRSSLLLIAGAIGLVVFGRGRMKR